MTKFETLPTYADVALRAGVSTKTVCNVIGNPGMVRGKTIEKVLAALRELGVDDVAEMKVRQRPVRPSQEKTLLFLEAGMPLGSSGTPFFGSIFQAAETQAHEQGWQFLLRHKRADERLEDALRNFRGSAVILFGKATRCDELRALDAQLAVVRLLAAPDPEENCDSVDYDRREVVHLALDHLRKAGCRRIAYLGPDDDRFFAFQSAGRENRIEVVDGSVRGLFVDCGRSQAVQRGALEEAWNRIAQVGAEGIFVHSDQVTNALYPLLAEKGVRPMRDVFIVSCNAEETFLGPLHPRPATIDVHPSVLGTRCVDTLLWRMQNLSAPPMKVILRPRLLPGDQTAWSPR